MIEFSVIIPVKNNPEGLSVTLNSVIKTMCDKSEAEIIVVNDGGSQKITDTINSYKCDKLEEIKTKVAKGPGIARNTGADIAKGKYLVFVDDDIELPESWVSKVRPYLDAYDYFAFNVKIKQAPRETPLLRLFRLNAFNTKRFFLNHNFGVTAFLIVSKEIFYKAGKFNINFKWGEDYLFGKSILETGGRQVYLDEVIAWHMPKSLNEHISNQKRYARSIRIFDKANGGKKKLLILELPKSILRFFYKLLRFRSNTLYRESEMSDCEFFTAYFKYLLIHLKIHLTLEIKGK